MGKRFLSVVLTAALVLSLFSAIPITAKAASAMKASDKCVEMIKEMEGFIAIPVWDYGQWTVGFGTACPAEDLARYQKEGIPMDEAHALVKKHIAEFEREVNSFIGRRGLTLNQGQFDALVSLTYNVGPALLYDSSGTLLNAILTGATGNEFIYAISLWCAAGGQFLSGLMRRRLVEANMYLNGKYSTKAPDNYCYVIYNPNGGERDALAQGYDCNMPAVPMSVPTYKGHTFLGWYTAAEGGTKITSLNEATHGMTLYAHWKEGTGTAQPPTIPSSVKVTVTGSSVYVRSGPGITHGIVGGVFKGDQMTITAVCDVNGTPWGQFSKGWICLDYTNYAEIVGSTGSGGEEEPGEEKPVIPVPVNATVLSGSGITVYNGPHTSYPQIGKLQKGQQIEILETMYFQGIQWARYAGGWFQLNLRVMLHDSTLLAHSFITTVNYYSLNIRSAPGTDNTKVGSLNNGTKIEIFALTTVDGTPWGRIDQGWVSLEYTTYDAALLPQYQNHVYGDWYTSREATCVEKGEERRKCEFCDHCETRETALADHSYGEWYISKEATCTEAGEERRDCLHCDRYETRQTALADHSHGDWYISKEATCTEAGEERRDCQHCGRYEARELAPLGHSFGPWHETKAPTADEAGEECRECQQCGYTETRALEPTLHVYGPWYAVKDATCTEAGEERRDCQHCEHYEVRETAVIDHSYGDWHTTKAATCTEAGEEQRACQHCDRYEVREIAVIDHTYGDWHTTKAATCTEAGEERRECRSCDHYEVRKTAATGHSYGAWYVSREATYTENGEERRDCQHCDHYETRQTPHKPQPVTKTYGTMTNASYAFLNVRSNPGFQYNVLAKLAYGGRVEILERKVVNGDTWGRIRQGWICLTGYMTLETVIVNGDGEKVVRTYATVTCDLLNVRRGAGTSYTRLGQLKQGERVEILEQKKVGNDTWGRTEQGWIQLNGYTMLETVEEISGQTHTEHTYGDWHTTKAATCTEAGEERRECQHCDHYEVREIAVIDHSYGDWHTTKAATCTEAGEERRECRSCDHYEVRKTAATGHSYGAWYVSKEATYTENGEERRDCQHCDHCETRQTPHKPQPVTKTYGTMTNASYAFLNIRSNPGFQYSVLDKLAYGGRVEILERKVVNGDTWGRVRQGWVCLTGYMTLETVVANGNGETVVRTYATVTCDLLNVRRGAGTSYTRLGQLKQGERVELLEQKKVGNDTWGRTEQGWIQLNGYTMLETVEEISGQTHTEHTYGDWHTTKAATCTEAGEERRDCQFCDHYEVRKTAATGHSYGAWYVSKEATYTENGEERRDCQHCDHCETRQTPCKPQPVIKTYGTMTNASYAFLNIRSNAGFQYNVLGKLAYGDRVEILERRVVNGDTWGRVRQGWVCLTGYMTLETVVENSDGETVIRTYATVTCDLLNVRRGAGTNYTRLGQLKQGERVELLEQKKVGSNTWGRTEQGWIQLNGYTMLETVEEISGQTHTEHTYGDWYVSKEATFTEKGVERRDCQYCGHYETRQTPCKPLTVTKTYGTMTNASYDYLNIRTDAGFQYSISDRLPYGVRVEILEQKVVGSDTWGRIRQGWICLTGYMTLETATVSNVEKEPDFDYPGAAVSDAWFSNTLFIGDSRVVGLREFARSGSADYFCAAGLTVFEVCNKQFSDKNFTAQNLESLLASRQYDKIYISFGLNEAGYALSYFISHYQKLLSRIRALQPNAVIILQATLPVTKDKAAELACFEPSCLALRDEAVKALADGVKTFYVDPNEYFTDEEGYLLDALSADGCHLTLDASRHWRDWIAYIVGTLGI